LLYGRNDLQPFQESFDRIADLIPTLSKDVKVALALFKFTGDNGVQQYMTDPGVAAAIVERGGVPTFPKDDYNLFSSNEAKLYVDRQVATGVKTILIAGVTLNTCVRLSATEIADRYNALGVRVVLDSNFVGARRDNGLRRCSHCIDIYLDSDIDFDMQACTCDDDEELLCSPNDLTVQLFRRHHVEVVDDFYWAPLQI